ncbi:hypothetical protein BU17DRAFT_74941 [Hysterangium stoloniferum]|nr:hypothetical protein BU17DRAFT_74941 [Hysterangium stoloniferum]
MVVLASVDGKLHGLNRTTGRVLWSMADEPSLKLNAVEAHAAFDSLVRTQHVPEETDREFFIIEPQSGDIYVLPPMASASDSIQKLPFSMQQLVEMSPFSFPGDDNRVFVGKKETSMLIIELETGKVKGAVNADKECFWDRQEESVEEEIDLDELDGTKPPKHMLQTHIHIGRTDYHVRVHSRHQGVVQNLFYSSYGPNNIDKDKQSRWRRTPDDLYIQSLPDGYVFAFQAEGPDVKPDVYDGMPVWGREFTQPIVAVFDIVSTPSRANPLALLQPRSHLEHLFPKRATSKNRHPNTFPEVTFVGVIGNSLYAMSPQNYPLVVFDQTPPKEIPEQGLSVTQPCEWVQCLTGVRKSEPGLQWYVPPQLDAVPAVPALEERVPPRIDPAGENDVNESVLTIGDGTVRDTQVEWTYAGADLRMWGILGFTVFLCVVSAKFLMGFWNGLQSPFPGSPSPGPVQAELSIPVPTTPLVESIPETAPPVLVDVDVPVPVVNTDTDTSPPLQIPTSPLPSTPKPDQQVHLPTPPPNSAPAPGADQGNGDDSEKEDAPRKKPRRRKRGRGGKKVNVLGEKDEDDARDVLDEEPFTPMAAVTPVTGVPPTPRAAAAPELSTLVVSDTVLGHGSQGTIVYEGSLQGRAVAVKRLLRDFVTIAAREVELLQESDDHPNVIRYYYKEFKDGFLYIALELCPASLADIVERPDAFSAIASVFDPKRGLAQITAGLQHLHMLKIVHRDIKPQNILVSRPKNGQHRMLISDFGLCKKLDVDQTSFLPTVHGAMAAGTVGWRAPEILRGTGSTVSARSAGSAGAGAKPTRLTKSVDIFALGCLFYYTLTGGSHPFGDRFEREGNILKGRMDLGALEQFGEEGVEAVHLISSMLDQDAKVRPDTTNCLIHPFFWTPARRLSFLQEASDVFEIMCRDPREAPLIALETGAFDVVGNDWHTRLDRVFVENLGKFRKYDGRSVQDLLRALRNKKHHYQDLPDHVKRHLGPLPEGFLGYFTRRFPGLFLHVHGVIKSCGLSRESVFRSYFELAES